MKQEHEKAGGFLGFMSHVSFTAFLFWLKRSLRERRYTMYGHVEENANEIKASAQKTEAELAEKQAVFTATKNELPRLPAIHSAQEFNAGATPAEIRTRQTNVITAVHRMQTKLDKESNDLDVLAISYDMWEKRLACRIRLPKMHVGKSLLDKIAALETGVKRADWERAFKDGSVIPDALFSYNNATNLKYVLAEYGVKAVVVNDGYNRSINGEDKSLRSETETRVKHVSRTQSIVPAVLWILLWCIAMISSAVYMGDKRETSVFITYAVVAVVGAAVIIGLLLGCNKPINILKCKLSYKIIAKDTPKYEEIMTLVLGSLAGAEHAATLEKIGETYLACYATHVDNTKRFESYTRAFLPERVPTLSALILEQMNAGAAFSEALWRVDQTIAREAEKQRRIAWELAESKKNEEHRAKMLEETNRHNKAMERERARARAAAEAAAADAAALKEYERERLQVEREINRKLR